MSDKEEKKMENENENENENILKKERKKRVKKEKKDEEENNEENNEEKKEENNEEKKEEKKPKKERKKRAKKEEENDEGNCSVCCSGLNKSTRRLVSCDFCPYIACLECTKTYILQTVHQPHCMNCRKEWSIEMMNKHFPRTFLNDEYRKMREKVLFEEEKTHLPPLQEEAERILSLAKTEKDIRALQVKINENNSNEDQMVRDQRLIHRRLDSDLGILYRKMSDLRYKRKPNIAKKFLMKCVVENCRGFLSETYKCGLCNVQVCKDCHHITNETTPKHECNPDDVATIAELKRSTKPCPKCHIPIYKTDGCDQMFCIQCHTAFSWRTGEIELGVIHNPHYFQALREGNIQDPRHRQDHGGCGPMPTYYEIYAITKCLAPRDRKLLEIYYQQFLHHRQVTLPELARRKDQEPDRIKYLIGEYDEKIFKQKLYVTHQHTLRKREERQIVDSFVTIGEELFRTLKIDNYPTILAQLETLRRVTYDAIQLLNQKYQHAGHVHPREFSMMYIV
jgi:hypothetical protein